MRSPVIKKNHVRLSLEPREVGPRASSQLAPGCKAEDRGEPEVNVIRQGEIISAIQVTCPCGHRMVLDCIYESAPEEAPPASP